MGCGAQNGVADDGKRALARLELVAVPLAPINANEVSVPGGPGQLGKLGG